MNRLGRHLLYLLLMPLTLSLVASLGLWSRHADAKPKRTKPAKKATYTLPTQVVQNPTGILTHQSDARYSSSSIAPEDVTAQATVLALPVEPSQNWASTISSHVMSQKVIDHLESKYTAAESHMLSSQILNFVYLYGFEATSQDVRGRDLYGIDPRQELAVRGAMTSSLKGYMLGKGLSEYLKTLEVTRPYVSAMERVQKASQFSMEIKAKEHKEAVNPGEGYVASETSVPKKIKPRGEQRTWKIKSGPDFSNQTVFASATDGAWGAELRMSLGLSDFTSTVTRGYYRSTYSVRYLSSSDVLTATYQYRFSTFWWGKMSSDFPTTGENQFARLFHSVGVRHLF